MDIQITWWGFAITMTVSAYLVGALVAGIRSGSLKVAAIWPLWLLVMLFSAS